MDKLKAVLSSFTCMCKESGAIHKNVNPCCVLVIKRYWAYDTSACVLIWKISLDKKENAGQHGCVILLQSILCCWQSSYSKKPVCIAEGASFVQSLSGLEQRIDPGGYRLQSNSCRLHLWPSVRKSIRNHHMVVGFLRHCLMSSYHNAGRHGVSQIFFSMVC